MTEVPTARPLQALEARLRRLEDERDIAQLLAAYGPLADSGAAEEVAALWEPTGVYDVDELHMSGQAEIASMVHSEGHQSWLERGCAHLLGPAHISVDNDAAVAIGHSLMIVRDGQGFRVRRVTANRWELRRKDGRWLVTRRTSRLLDGREEARSLLGGAVSR